MPVYLDSIRYDVFHSIVVTHDFNLVDHAKLAARGLRVHFVVVPRNQ